MKIVRKFRIQEVRASRSSNAPFQIVLEDDPFKSKGGSSLFLNADICSRYNISMSLDLMDRILVCSFDSRELPLGDSGYNKNHVDMKSLGNDDLAINSLKQVETITPSFGIIPPSKHVYTSQVIELSSFGGGDGIHPHIMPCPFYRFAVALSKEEYEACRALSATAIFKLDFHLA